MNRKIIIITIILHLSVLLFLGCATGEKCQTYRLDGVPLKHETKFYFLFWWSKTDDYGKQEFKVINKTNNTRESQNFNFSIGENIIGDNNGIWIWGEPYTLWMNFNIYDAKKIIINKLIFRSKSKAIDIRDKISISYDTNKSHSYISFKEEELINFRNYGIIDVSNINNEMGIVERIQFEYDNVDVLFKKDRFFTIECDITFDSDIEGYEPENYSFVAKFNRIQFVKERMSLLMYVLFYLFFKR